MKKLYSFNKIFFGTIILFFILSFILINKANAQVIYNQSDNSGTPINTTSSFSNYTQSSMTFSSAIPAYGTTMYMAVDMGTNATTTTTGSVVGSNVNFGTVSINIPGYGDCLVLGDVYTNTGFWLPWWLDRRSDSGNTEFVVREAQWNPACSSYPGGISTGITTQWYWLGRNATPSVIQGLVASDNTGTTPFLIVSQLTSPEIIIPTGPIGNPTVSMTPTFTANFSNPNNYVIIQNEITDTTTNNIIFQYYTIPQNTLSGTLDTSTLYTNLALQPNTSYSYRLRFWSTTTQSAWTSANTFTTNQNSNPDTGTWLLGDADLQYTCTGILDLGCQIANLWNNIIGRIQTTFNNIARTVADVAYEAIDLSNYFPFSVMTLLRNEMAQSLPTTDTPIVITYTILGANFDLINMTTAETWIGGGAITMFRNIIEWILYIALFWSIYETLKNIYHKLTHYTT